MDAIFALIYQASSATVMLPQARVEAMMALYPRPLCALDLFDYVTKNGSET